MNRSGGIHPWVVSLALGIHPCVGAAGVRAGRPNPPPPSAAVLGALWTFVLILGASGCIYVWHAAKLRARPRSAGSGDPHRLVLRWTARGLVALFAAATLALSLKYFS